MYSTIDKFKKRLKGYYDQLYLDPETDLVDDTLAEEDLAAASAEVDASAGMCYDIPVTAAKSLPLLENWELTIAEELAWKRSATGKTPEGTQNRVDVVRKALEKLAEGKIKLPGASESSGSAGGSVLTQCDTPVFTREKMSGF